MALYRQCVLVAVVALALAAGPAPAGPSYIFTPVGPPGVANFLAAGIDNAGTVVGYAANPSFTEYQSFAFANGTYTPVNEPNAAPLQTQVLAINSLGRYAGNFIDNNGLHGFVQTAGGFQTIDIPGGLTTAVLGSNSSGKTLVFSFNAATGPAYYTYQGGTATPLTLPSPIANFATGINDAGDVVGYYYGADSNLHGFVLHNGQFATLDDPDAAPAKPSNNFMFGTAALGINNAGDVVGYYVDAFGQQHGFLEKGGVYTTIDNPLGADLVGTQLTGINDHGDIVGAYTDFNNTAFSFLATPAVVPEPGTLTLLAVAGLAAGGRRLRRRF